MHLRAETLAYLCTAVGPAVGAMSAAHFGEGFRCWLGASVICTSVSIPICAVAIAAVCAVIASIVGVAIAAIAAATLGGVWRDAVCTALGTTTLDSTGKLVRKQSAKAWYKSLASYGLDALVGGSAASLSASFACAVAAAVLGATAAAVSLEALHSRSWSPHAARVTALNATLKTLIKTSISNGTKLAIRQLSLCGPLMCAGFSTGLGIGLRNAIVDWINMTRQTEQHASRCPPIKHEVGCHRHAKTR